jgi:hypothetical protein
MKKILALTLTLFTCISMAQLPFLIPCVKNQLWGACDSTKKNVIPYQYEEMKYINNDLLVGTSNNGQRKKFDLYEKSGKMIGTYDHLEHNYSDGFIRASSGIYSDFGLTSTNTTLFDPLGNLVDLSIKFAGIKEFSENCAEVICGSKHGFINKQGKLVVPAKYDWVDKFYEGRAWVVINEGKSTRFGSVDTTGNEIWMKTYSNMGSFNDTYRTVGTFTGIGAILKNGVEAVPPSFGEIDYRTGGYFSAKGNVSGKYSLWKNGKQLSQEKYDEISYPQEGIFKVRRDDLYGYIDSSGAEIIPVKYQVAADPNGGVILVYYGGSSGAYDIRGKLIVPFGDMRPGEFRNGFSSVQKDGHYALVNNDGKLLTSFKYDAPIIMNVYGKDTLGCVKVDKKYGLITSRGSEYTFIYYDVCPYTQQGLIVARCNGKSGVMNKHGDTVLPFRYDEITPYQNNTWIFTKGGYTYISDSTLKMDSLNGNYKYMARFGSSHFLVPEGRQTAILNSKFEKVMVVQFHNHRNGKLPYSIFSIDGNKYGIMNSSAQVLVQPEYVGINTDVYFLPRTNSRLNNLLFWAMKDNKIGWLDIHGTFYAD